MVLKIFYNAEIDCQHVIGVQGLALHACWSVICFEAVTSLVSLEEDAAPLRWVGQKKSQVKACFLTPLLPCGCINRGCHNICRWCLAAARMIITQNGCFPSSYCTTLPGGFARVPYSKLLTVPSLPTIVVICDPSSTLGLIVLVFYTQGRFITSQILTYSSHNR
ncbi:uncharacterized protein PgNI_03507 [Pyricularia grisea]|uniref:Uncharacterized protein n=1 Tax=Pyricularia grisea TaxID=148305 RepID=A0A6P8BEZ5_PYRGI|nr:uncharacterized protein PgNI_03507 [Pyricularia grisea]TLD14277.1 hypothetical protein PgNI_03507 [Pyricularia grisea]